MVM
jgi:hypothetical protein